MRLECACRYWFLDLDDAREKVEDWRTEYNEVRPHSAIGPSEQIKAMRKENLREEFARRLHQHCVEEMGYLAEVLPVLYRRHTLDNTL